MYIDTITLPRYPYTNTTALYKKQPSNVNKLPIPNKQTLSKDSSTPPSLSEVLKTAAADFVAGEL